MHQSVVRKESLEIKEEPLTCGNETNVGSEKAKFICALCDSEFETEFILNQHISSYHKENNQFKRGIFDHSFSQKDHLKRHLESVNEQKKPFKCNICDHSCSKKK